MTKKHQEKKGRVIIISGPAGVGKDTIIKGILKKHPDFVMIKSYTTRPQRESDEVGNRIFVSPEKFQQMIKDDQFIEWAKVHQWYYGRRRADIVRHIETGNDVMMDVDVQGAKSLEKIMPEVVSVFIKYENPGCFLRRLQKNRPEMSDEELAIRQKSMEKEMEYEKFYDYSVVNHENHPEKAIEEMKKIIKNELYIES